MTPSLMPAGPDALHMLDPSSMDVVVVERWRGTDHAAAPKYVYGALLLHLYFVFFLFLFSFSFCFLFVFVCVFVFVFFFVFLLCLSVSVSLSLCLSVSLSLLNRAQTRHRCTLVHLTACLQTRLLATTQFPTHSRWLKLCPKIESRLTWQRSIG